MVLASPSDLISQYEPFRKHLHVIAALRGPYILFMDKSSSAKPPERKRGRLGGAPAPAPGGAAHALNNSLGLHNGSKRWCEWLSDIVLGPGTLETGYGLSRHGWEFRVRAQGLGLGV